MLDFEQQANQAQALASLDEDWHLLGGECTTFIILFYHSFFLPSDLFIDVSNDGIIYYEIK